ncbi:hypothetical protein PVAP13_5KG695750 [Panicum virgatum]|uniref:Uncharacterized protein n=1 Tax=Panicum virgatum TaxID=38727 RepID=A0A8T0T2H6_PANVG|nr:hypothetical protein PVAP13_5KG695750 [Panicum virgatum]
MSRRALPLFAVVLLAAVVALGLAARCADAARPVPPSPAAGAGSAAYKAVVSALMEMLPQGPSSGGGGH